MENKINAILIHEDDNVVTVTTAVEVERLEKDLDRISENARTAQPSPGNRAGGLSTLEEKSLGCIHKGGTTPVMEVIEYKAEVYGFGFTETVMSRICDYV